MLLTNAGRLQYSISDIPNFCRDDNLHPQSSPATNNIVAA
jgi:hypothetical protein